MLPFQTIAAWPSDFRGQVAGFGYHVREADPAHVLGAAYPAHVRGFYGHGDGDHSYTVAKTTSAAPNGHSGGPCWHTDDPTAVLGLHAAQSLDTVPVSAAHIFQIARVTDRWANVLRLADHADWLEDVIGDERHAGG